MRHRLHALCPYFAMFPESFPEKWIGELTRPGDVVLDPFCGRGTTPFQALLMGRRAVASDINPVAYCVTRAKTAAPSASAVERRVGELQARFAPDAHGAAAEALPDFFRAAYSGETLRQLLYLRDTLSWRRSNVDCMIAALVLGRLHGETDKSREYLSAQMPRTISPKPAYSIRFWQRRGDRPPERDVFEFLRRQAAFRYATPPPSLRGMTVLDDVRRLPRHSSRFPGPVKCVVTSPPYFNVTRCEEDQWLRLWFLGGPPHPTYGLVSHDDRHECLRKYWALIRDTWATLGAVLAEGAHVVIRLGGKGLGLEDVVGGLQAASTAAGRRVELLRSERSELRQRQTGAFRPGSAGCVFEVDCLFAVN